MRLLRVVFALAVTFGLVLVAGIAPRPALAAELVVGDDYSCDRDGLAAAIDAAGAEDIIRFSCDTATIDFGEDEAIEIDSSIIIDGSNDGEAMTLDGNDQSRFFEVNDGGDLTLLHLTLIDGNPLGNGGAIHVTDQGSLTVDHTIFDNNRALNFHGGAIFSRGSLTVRNSVFTGNLADHGGAIQSFGTLFISNSLFENNSANDGGAIFYYNGDEVTIVGSSFVNNQAGVYGGAIFGNDGELIVVASTFTGNRADAGSAFWLSQTGTTAHIAWSTIVGSDNTVPSLQGSQFTWYELEGVVLAGDGDDCLLDGSSLTDSYTLSDDTSCGLSGVGSAQGITIDLGQVENSIVDGVMQTYYPLVADSTAVDGGPSTCDTDIVPGVDTDQLGNPRPQHYFCDIGAIESTFKSELLCVNNWTGELTFAYECGRSETLIEMPNANAPLDLCVNQWNGAAHVGSDCDRSEYLLKLIGDGNTTACVNRWNNSLRISDRCSRSEREVSL